MKNSLDLPAKPVRNAPHVATLLVSVFLMLLAFFMALNANSDFDSDRSGAVLSSVKKKFSGERESKTPPPNKESFVDPVNINTFFDDVKVSIATLVPLHETQTTIQGNSLQMTMPENSLFLRGESKLRQDRLEFYAVLSDILSRWGESADITINMVQGISPEDKDAAKLAIARGGNFARFLENKGAPPELIAIATTEQNPGQITLQFDVRPYTPRQKEGE